MRRGGLRFTAGGRRRVLLVGAIVAALALLAGAALAYTLGTTEGLCWCVMHAPHRYLREACVWRLPREDARTADTLIVALGDADKDVRYGAAVRLRSFPDHPDVVPALLRALEDPDSLVQSGAVWSLGAIRDRAAYEPIIALADHPDAVVRAAVASVLGYYPDRRGIPALGRLVHDADPDVRQRAAASLEVLARLPE
ncbi:MAG: hypothetical protein Kow00120_06680 [Anaerolineae bacterium]